MEFSNIISGSLPSEFISKLVFTILLLFYLFYAILMSRQIGLMNEFLETKLSPWTKTVGIIHIVCVLLLILVVIII